MRPISMTELAEYARQLPHGSTTERRGPRYSVMRRHDVPMSYREYERSYHDPIMVDRLDFLCRRERLGGTYVWAWTYNDIIVKVDV